MDEEQLKHKKYFSWNTYIFFWKLLLENSSYLRKTPINVAVDSRNVFTEKPQLSEITCLHCVFSLLLLQTLVLSGWKNHTGCICKRNPYQVDEDSSVALEASNLFAGKSNYPTLLTPTLKWHFLRKHLKYKYAKQQLNETKTSLPVFLCHICFLSLFLPFAPNWDINAVIFQHPVTFLLSIKTC